jgi:hypothetical protein
MLLAVNHFPDLTVSEPFSVSNGFIVKIAALEAIFILIRSDMPLRSTVRYRRCTAYRPWLDRVIYRDRLSDLPEPRSS